MKDLLTGAFCDSSSHEAEASLKLHVNRSLNWRKCNFRVSYVESTYPAYWVNSQRQNARQPRRTHNDVLRRLASSSTHTNDHTFSCSTHDNWWALLDGWWPRVNVFWFACCVPVFAPTVLIDHLLPPQPSIKFSSQNCACKWALMMCQQKQVTLAYVNIKLTLIFCMNTINLC